MNIEDITHDLLIELDDCECEMISGGLDNGIGQELQELRELTSSGSFSNLSLSTKNLGQFIRLHKPLLRSGEIFHEL